MNTTAIEFARIRIVREVQYVLGVSVDGVPDDKETWPAWAAYKASHGSVSTNYVGAPGDRRENFARDVQSFLEIGVDGDPRTLTNAAWVRHAYSEIIAAAVQPLPIYYGAKPVMSSGFNGPGNLGPNRSRWWDIENKKWGHLGNDWEYYWNQEGDPPKGWEEYQFENRRERMFYGPPVGVLAVLAGTVEDVSFTEYDDGTTEDDRYTIKINHGVWPNMGHLTSRSTHHSKPLVKEGDKVEATTAIAIMGDRGSEGAPHDHHEFSRWRPGEKIANWYDAKFDPYPLFREFRMHDPGVKEHERCAAA